MPERYEHCHKDLKSNEKLTQNDHENKIEIDFYKTGSKSVQKEYNSYKSGGRKSTNPTYDRQSKYIYSRHKNNSSSGTRGKAASNENSMYMSPGKLKKKAKNSQVIQDGTSSEKGSDKLKYNRVKSRRKTNPEEASSSKFVLTAKKYKTGAKFTPNCQTPKSITCHSKLASSASSKDKADMKDKFAKPSASKQILIPDYSGSTIFGIRKNSTQGKKIGQIMLTPSDRTLLKPRKNIKNISTSKIKIVSNSDKEPKKAKMRYNYATNKV